MWSLFPTSNVVCLSICGQQCTISSHLSFRKLSAYMRELCVDLYEYELGLRATMSDVVYATLKRLPDEVLQQISPNLSDTHLSASFVYGLDGSGDHAVYNTEESLSADIDTTHFMLAGMALSSIHGATDKSLSWHDEKMCSSTAERTFMIVPGREKQDLVEKMVKLLDDEADQVLAFCPL